jgi:hypothetical protein
MTERLWFEARVSSIPRAAFLPLSKNPALDKNLGTRGIRAALGLTEETDALVIIVSEENKSVGWVQSGHLHLNAEAAKICGRRFMRVLDLSIEAIMGLESHFMKSLICSMARILF